MADSAGESVSALNAEMSMEMAMVTANCWNSVPVMPGSSREGRNTAASTRAMAMTGPDTSSMAAKAAWRGVRPRSMWDSTASTTTMASSTTRPMASTMPMRQMVFNVKPRRGNSAKVAMMETGTAMAGISVARQPCRKTNTTRTTSRRASTSVCSISSMEARTASVVSSVRLYSIPAGKLRERSSKSLTRASTVLMALEPGAAYTAMAPESLPLYLLDTL